MLANLIIATICLVLGWFGRDWVVSWVLGRRQRAWEKRKTTLRDKSEEWLKQYYGKSNHKDELYSLSGKDGARIPYLTRKAWYGSHVRDTRIEIKDHSNLCRVKIDKRVIRNRTKMGQEIWDDPTLCFMGIGQQENKIQIETRVCQYFQYLSRCGKLEDELYKCILSKRKKPRLRDEQAPSLDALESTRLETQIIGVAAAVVFRHHGKVEILIQERSDKTAIAGGTYAMVPSFVFNPDNLKDVPMDILLHTFLLEFYEELYDREELVRKSKHLEPTWFYSEEPIKTLLELHKSGKFQFEVLGFGFDGVTGEFNIAALALVENDEFVDYEIRRMKRNWEIHDFRLIALDSDELRKQLFSKKQYVTSKFCLSLVFDKFSIQKVYDF